MYGLEIAYQYFHFHKDYAISEWGSSSAEGPEQPTNYFRQLLKVMFIVCVVACLLIARERYDDYIRVTSQKHLHHDMLEKLLNAPINNFFDVQPIGSVLQKFQGDTVHFDGVAGNSFALCCISFHIIKIFILIVLAGSKEIVLILPLMALYAYRKQTEQLPIQRCFFRFDRERSLPLHSHYSEMLQGATTIRAFGAVEYEQEIQLDLINQWLHMALMSRATYLRYSMHMKTMSLLAMFASLVFILYTKKNALLHETAQAMEADAEVDLDTGEVRSVARKVLDPIIMAIALQKLLELGDLLTVLLNEYRDLEYRVLVMQRCFTLLDVPQEPSDQPRVQDKAWPSRGELEVKDLDFRYRPNLDLVLSNVNFKIEAGEKIGVVGRTGAGKSTLTLALMRLIDSERGQILVDGVNILDVNLQQVREMITIIPQE